jgi:hypothetical protein
MRSQLKVESGKLNVLCGFPFNSQLGEAPSTLNSQLGEAPCVVQALAVAPNGRSPLNSQLGEAPSTLNSQLSKRSFNALHGLQIQQTAIPQ